MDRTLDQLLPAGQQYRYHNFLKTCSFYYGIIPEDEYIRTRMFASFRYAYILFMFSLAVRTVTECFLRPNSVVFLLLGDFKIWWGEPYMANQVVFLTAVFVVPCYQFINLCTICPKDYEWGIPFKFIEGLKTAREIKLQDTQQMNKLFNKMKFNYFQAMGTHLSVLCSYSKLDDKCLCPSAHDYFV